MDFDQDRNKSTYDPYTELAHAIIYQAVEDYRRAVATEKIHEDRLQNDAKMSDKEIEMALSFIRFAKRDQKEIERFFESTYCESLSNVNCHGICKKLKKQVLNFIQRNYDMLDTPRFKEITKEKWISQSKENISQFDDIFTCPICGKGVDTRYQILGTTTKNKKLINKYGWRTSCPSCKFQVKIEKERIEAR